HIFYRRRTVASDDPRMGLQQALFAAADELPLDDPMQLRLGALQKHREHNSISFFHENAARFRQQQDLIAGPERYATAVAAALTSAATQRRQLALEIGPGEGWLLPRLSALFDKVVALDNAAAMLEASRSSAARAQLENVEFVLGDTSIAALDNLNADLVVINMVLHHTPDPALTLAQAANCLSPGGVLLVTELCAHEQGWARESCGDLWLGFEPQLIEDWARAAGLEEFSSDYLAQRNGFTLQVRLFSAAHSALS
ncbi:MAG: ubiquinone/menaquinone biosynthesis C-methylase UbiE, partial [Halieaceae bacterium]